MRPHRLIADAQLVQPAPYVRASVGITKPQTLSAAFEQLCGCIWSERLGTGVLGGFTTYSTFMVETADRLRNGHAPLALAYLVGSVILCLLAAGLGISLTARTHRARRTRRGTR